MEIKNHLLTDAYVNLTKKRGGVITPSIIVMHYTAGWTFMGDCSTLGVDQSARVSVQLVVGRKPKQLAQLVPFNRRAWHAGPSFHKPSGLSDINSHSVGIEISNHGYVEDMGNGEYRTWNGKTYHNPPSSEAADFDLWVKHEHPVLGAAKSKRAVWEPYTDYQLDILDDIVRSLVKKYPTIKYVASHEEIDTRGWKTDPGPEFPMKRYQKIVENRGEVDPAEAETSDADPGRARPYYVTADVHIRQQPRWFGECNIVKTAPAGSTLFVMEDYTCWGEFSLCFYEKDGTLLKGWVPWKYITKEL